MKKTWPLLIVLALALAGAAGYFLFVAPRARPPAPVGPLQKITIANVGQFSIFNLIARDHGFFKDNGLDAQVDEYDSGAPSMGALLADKADFAVAADFVGVVNMFSRSDLRILAQASEHQVFRLVARRDKGIDTPLDLKGKKIGVTKRTAGEYYLGRFLTLNGLDLKDVEEVDLKPQDMMDQLGDGRLDAVLTFEPHAYDLQQKLGAGGVSWSAQGNQDATALIYAKSGYLEAHPDVAVKYVRALAEAADYVWSHDAEARGEVGKALGYGNDYMAYVWPKFDFAVGLKQSMILTMEEQARWLIDSGLVPQTRVPNYLGFVYFDALEKVAPAEITILHPSAS